MHDAPLPRPSSPHSGDAPAALTPLSRLLAVCALDGKAAAARMAEEMSAPQRSALHQESAASGLESLTAAILDAPDAMSKARARIERFRFAQHLNAAGALAGLLAAHGVRVLLIKGAPLALRRYVTQPFHPWMRPLGDIDLFVHPDTLPRAFDILENAGLSCADVGGQPDFSTRHAITLRGAQMGRFDGLWVELHAHLSHSPWREHLEFGALFCRGTPWVPPGMPEETQAMRPPGAMVRLLSDEDETVFLASHGAGHRFAHPKWLLDMALALSPVRTPEQWARLKRRAAEAGCASALDLSRELLQRACPPHTDASQAHWQTELSSPLTWRRIAFRTACDLGDGAALPRGALTCLALTDAFSLRQLRPAAALALEKIRRRFTHLSLPQPRDRKK